MKFSCEKETLLNLLNIASRAVTGKSSMPLLEGLLLAADADTLTITGYDLSMGIRTTAQVDVVEPGRIVLNSRLFCDIVRKLPQDVVYLETDDKLMTTIKCNLTFSMALNFIAILLAMTGILDPVVGALVHNAGSVLVIVNSAFLLKWRKKS